MRRHIDICQAGASRLLGAAVPMPGRVRRIRSPRYDARVFPVITIMVACDIQTTRCRLYFPQFIEQISGLMFNFENVNEIMNVCVTQSGTSRSAGMAG